MKNIPGLDSEFSNDGGQLTCWVQYKDNNSYFSDHTYIPRLLPLARLLALQPVTGLPLKRRLIQVLAIRFNRIREFPLCQCNYLPWPWQLRFHGKLEDGSFGECWDRVGWVKKKRWLNQKFFFKVHWLVVLSALIDQLLPQNKYHTSANKMIGISTELILPISLSILNPPSSG